MNDGEWFGLYGRIGRHLAAWPTMANELLIPRSWVRVPPPSFEKEKWPTCNASHQLDLWLLKHKGRPERAASVFAVCSAHSTVNTLVLGYGSGPYGPCIGRSSVCASRK